MKDLSPNDLQVRPADSVDFDAVTDGHVNAFTLANWTNKLPPLDDVEGRWVTELAVPLAGEARPYSGLHLLEAAVRSDLMKLGFGAALARAIYFVRMDTAAGSKPQSWTSERLAAATLECPELRPDTPQTFWLIRTEFNGHRGPHPLITVAAVLPVSMGDSVSKIMKKADPRAPKGSGVLFDITDPVRRVYAHMMQKNS